MERTELELKSENQSHVGILDGHVDLTGFSVEVYSFFGRIDRRSKQGRGEMESKGSPAVEPSPHYR